MSNHDDPLVQQAVEGDQEALQTLIGRHHDQLESWLRARIAHRWQPVLGVEDVLQETYIDACMDIHRFVPRGEDAFRNWLFAIARNNLNGAIESLKAEKRGGRRKLVNTGDDAHAELFELVLGSSTPSRRIVRAEAAKLLKAAIDKLPSHYRNLVQMYDIDNVDMKVAGTTIGKSEGAAFMQRRRALDALRKLLMDSLQDYSDYS